jgi:hypothetical protein
VSGVGGEHTGLTCFAPKYRLHRSGYFTFIEDAIAILIKGTTKLKNDLGSKTMSVLLLEISCG